MNKSTMTAIAVVLVLLFGGFFLVNQRSQTKMVQENEAMDKNGAKDEASIKQEDDKMMVSKSASRYVEYSKDVLDQANDKRRVLYFYATWCPSCKAANEDFSANPNKIPEDVVVIRTNYNDPNTDQEEKDLAKKYGITYQHTFVQIDSQGKEVAKWNGGDTDELLTNIK